MGQARQQEGVQKHKVLQWKVEKPEAYSLTLDEVMGLVEMFCYDRFPGDSHISVAFNPRFGRERSRQMIESMLERVRKSKGGKP